MKRSSRIIIICLGVGIGTTVFGLLVMQSQTWDDEDSTVLDLLNGTSYLQNQTAIKVPPHIAASCSKTGDHKDYKIMVVSPQQDLGCVYWYTAEMLAPQGWKILEEYPQEFMRDINYKNSKEYFEQTYNIDKIGYQKYGHHVDLSISDLPVTGQSATVILDVSVDGAAPLLDVIFRITVYGDVDITSSDPKLVRDKWFPGLGVTSNLVAHGIDGQIRSKSVDTERVFLVPGLSEQFEITITPTKEGKVRIHAVGIREYGQGITNSDDIYLTVGDKKTEYQIGKNTHVREPSDKYVWVERPIPYFWTSPWHIQGQTVQDYFNDIGITVLESKHTSGNPLGMCTGGGCRDGSIMFLTHESHIEEIPDMHPIPFVEVINHIPEGGFADLSK